MLEPPGLTGSVKHYIANEQETNRNPEGDVAAVSSNIDDKTMHELYLWYEVRCRSLLTSG